METKFVVNEISYKLYSISLPGSKIKPIWPKLAWKIWAIHVFFVLSQIFVTNISPYTGSVSTKDISYTNATKKKTEREVKMNK